MCAHFWKNTATSSLNRWTVWAVWVFSAWPKKIPASAASLETWCGLIPAPLWRNATFPKIVHGDKRIWLSAAVIPMLWRVSTKRRNTRQPCGERTRRSAGSEQTTSANARPRTQTARHPAVRFFGRYRQQPDRSQRNQPDQFQKLWNKRFRH